LCFLEDAQGCFDAKNLVRRCLFAYWGSGFALGRVLRGVGGVLALDFGAKRGGNARCRDFLGANCRPEHRNCRRNSEFLLLIELRTRILTWGSFLFLFKGRILKSQRPCRFGRFWAFWRAARGPLKSNLWLGGVYLPIWVRVLLHVQVSGALGVSWGWVWGTRGGNIPVGRYIGVNCRPEHRNCRRNSEFLLLIGIRTRILTWGSFLFLFKGRILKSQLPFPKGGCGRIWASCRAPRALLKSNKW